MQLAVFSDRTPRPNWTHKFAFNEFSKSISPCCQLKRRQFTSWTAQREVHLNFRASSIRLHPNQIKEVQIYCLIAYIWQWRQWTDAFLAFSVTLLIAVILHDSYSGRLPYLIHAVSFSSNSIRRIPTWPLVSTLHCAFYWHMTFTTESERVLLDAPDEKAEEN